MAHYRTLPKKYKAADLPRASLCRDTGAMVEVAAGRHIRAKGLRNFTAGRGPASWRKLIRELYEEHRALGGRERQPSLEKATCGELQKIARQIGLTNQTLRGERKTAP